MPPQLAAWVPPDVRHDLEILTPAELWMIHVDPRAIDAWGFAALLTRPFALRVTPLLRALLAEAVSIDLDAPKAELLVQLMLHELTAMPDAPTFLPMPSSSAGRRVPTSSSRTRAARCVSTIWLRARRRRSARQAGCSQRRPG